MKNKERTTLLLISIFFAFILSNCGSESSNIINSFNSPSSSKITTPIDESIFDEGTRVTFIGSGKDAYDGVLNSNQLVWTSDKDGTIGTGEIFDMTLSKNTHLITLTVTDSDGAEITDSITVIVRTPWIDPQWTYRQMITIDAAMTRSSLTDFPILIQITDQNNHLFGNAQTNGHDILFTKSDGISQLNHEIDFYSALGINELDAWIRMEEFSDFYDSVIYMYYGNTSISSQDNSTLVWDDNYVMVHHLNEILLDGVSGHFDSTINGNNGTPDNFLTGSGTTDSYGQINGANDFDGEDDCIRINDFNEVDSSGTELSVFLWMKAPPAQEGGDALVAHFDGPADQRSWGMYNGVLKNSLQNRLHVGITSTGTTTDKVYVSSIDIFDNQFHHVGFTFSSGILKLYIDGEEDSDVYKVWDQVSTTIYNSTNDIFIGCDSMYNMPDYWVNSIIDEVRISNVARSADWIQASYNNQGNPSMFIDFTFEEHY